MSQIAQCSGCSTKLRLPEGVQKAKCPKCGQILSAGAAAPTVTSPQRVAGSPQANRSVPSPPAEKQAGGNATGKGMTIKCPKCQAALKLPATAAGKKVRCPKCSATLQVPQRKPAATARPTSPSPAPKPTRPAPAPAAAGGFGDDDLFGDLPSQPATPGFGPASGAGDPFSAPVGGGNFGGYQHPYASPAPTKHTPRASSGGWQSWLTEPGKLLKLCAMVAAGSFLLSAIPLLGIFIFVVIAVSYVAIQTIGGVWLMVIAFQEDVVQGLLYLFIPFYALFYLISRWETCRVPFMLCIVSVISGVFGFMGMSIGTVLFGAMLG